MLEHITDEWMVSLYARRQEGSGGIVRFIFDAEGSGHADQLLNAHEMEIAFINPGGEAASRVRGYEGNPGGKTGTWPQEAPTPPGVLTRTFEIDYPADCGPMWMNRDNLLLCLRDYCKGVDFEVRDVTDREGAPKEPPRPTQEKRTR